MTPQSAFAVILGVVLLALTAALLLRRRGARVRDVSAQERIDPAVLGVHRLGGAGTIVQFSTEYCARCPGTERLISELVRDETDVSFVHVDVTRDPALVTKFNLLQTPTVLFIDATGRPRTRLSGVLSRTILTQELATLTGGTP